VIAPHIARAMCLVSRTAETLDANGRIHTGDVGEIDADGFIRVVDRKKEPIINAMGKNMSPANIENTLEGGLSTARQRGRDRRPYVTALVVLDPDAAGAFARAHGMRS
jgi:long-chain acyl-CoA synthetase